MARDKVKPIVIDNGSGWIKAGFSDEAFPSVVFPNIIGRPRFPRAMVGMRSRSSHIGEEALAQRGVLTSRYPIQHGIIMNWDDMIKIWTSTFEALETSADQHPILLSEACLNPKENREKMTQVMFEYYDVPATFIANQPLLSLYGCGKTDGAVLDSGDGVTQALCVSDGYSITPSCLRLNLGGRDLTEYLCKLLTGRGYYFTSSSDKLIVEEIKYNLGFVSTNYTDDMQKANWTSEYEATYKLPDGQPITIGDERFRCVEPLFKPSLLGLEAPGAHELLYESVMKCDLDVRRNLLKNVVLSGGSTMLSGMSERFENELDMITSSDVEPKVLIDPDRSYLVWKGGAVLSTLSKFQDKWITREQYMDEGPAIVHRKCM